MQPERTASDVMLLAWRQGVNRVTSLFRYAALAGNVLFILWITRNGIKEGFRGTPPEIASYVGLVALLVLNSVLLWRSRK
jgi:hypothetical protein